MRSYRVLALLWHGIWNLAELEFYWRQIQPQPVVGRRNTRYATQALPGGGGGVLPEQLGRGERPASLNPHPVFFSRISDFSTLFMTWPKVLYLTYAGCGWQRSWTWYMKGFCWKCYRFTIKNTHNLRLECKNYPYLKGQNGRNRYLIYDQNDWKPYPLRPRSYITHIRE